MQQQRSSINGAVLCTVLAGAVSISSCAPSAPIVKSDSPDNGGIPVTIQITSTAFGEGQPIPKKHTGDGADVSPPLAWTNAPADAKSFALICDDPDAPTPSPWVHWVIFNLPAGTDSLPEGVPNAQRPGQPAGAIQGENSFGKGATIGYRGPAPPPGHGTHHYHFKLYALDAELQLAPGATKEELLRAMESHILARGELVGTYER